MTKNAQVKDQEIYSLIVPMLGNPLLVPNVSVAELVPMGRVDTPEESHPKWFIGAFDWRGERVPLISFEQIIGNPVNSITNQSRVAIFNTLNDNSNMPFIGMVVQGIPRLSHITSEELEAIESDEKPDAVIAQVNYNNMLLDVPDLDYLEALIQ
jgi:chemosensory pili system protein ChpC